MKLTCYSEIVNRQLAGQNITSRKKPQHCVIAIGKQCEKDFAVYLLLQTRNDPTSSKYKLKDNVGNVFSKFINEGKLTIRLKEPAIDLNLSGANAVELKSFIRVLGYASDGRSFPSVSSLPNLNLKKIGPPSKKKLRIKSKQDYPVLKGFPRTIEELYLEGLGRKSFDRQILKLQSLRVLDLSNNLISSLPKDIGTLPHLKSLLLADNQLGTTQSRNSWSWLDQKNIQNNLQCLNLNGNQLKYLPRQVGKLSKLITLTLERNQLKVLPSSIGRLRQLNNLSVAKNQLTCLPGSLLKLRLETMNIKENFGDVLPLSLYSVGDSVPSLCELCARYFIDNRLNYDASIIPAILVDYLDYKAKYCPCGKSCFDSYIHKTMRMNPRIFAEITISTSHDHDFVFDFTFCSQKCAETLF